ncbi:putative haloacid dehalogenase-like hydrolase 7 [Elsinoe fawcettii]|nr:putative haloacid dehalogenase-like hydrolase 7 [Elsinoe fawcettii]
MAVKRQRRFAPMKDGASGHLWKVQGIVFDMDGTLCEPQNYMFGEMRSALGIDKSTDILDHIHDLPEAEQPAAHEKIEAIERRAMEQQVPQAGLVLLMEYLDRKGIKKGICTRNFDTPVNHLLANHIPGHINPFSPIITRGFRPPKPSPAGILHIAKAWKIVAQDTQPASEGRLPPEIPLIMVGDSIDDIIAGHDAGAATVLLRSPGKEELETDERTDLVIDRLDELISALEEDSKMPPALPVAEDPSIPVIGASVNVLDLPPEIINSIAKYYGCGLIRDDDISEQLAQVAIKTGLIDKKTTIVNQSVAEISPELDPFAMVSKLFRDAYLDVFKRDWSKIYIPFSMHQEFPPLPAHVKKQVKTILLTPLLDVDEVYPESEDADEDADYSSDDEADDQQPIQKPILGTVTTFYDQWQIDRDIDWHCGFANRMKKSAEEVFCVNVNHAVMDRRAPQVHDPLSYMHIIVDDFPRYKRLGFENLSVCHTEYSPYINEDGHIVQGKIVITSTSAEKKTLREVKWLVVSGDVSSDESDEGDEDFEVDEE